MKARPFLADFIIAAGGSVIDESKAIAVGACNETPLWDYFTRKAVFSTALPIIAIQTQPATSSELNGAAVITNDETMEGYLTAIKDNPISRFPQHNSKKVNISHCLE